MNSSFSGISASWDVPSAVSSVFKPTAEQAVCVDAFTQLIGTTKKMEVKAYAGSGKTSTLVLMGQAVNTSGIYICFNKSIATAAQEKFPSNVLCQTGHSLAFRAMRNSYSKNSNRDKMTGKVYVRDTVSLLQIRDFPIMGATAFLDKNTVAFAVNETVKKFCQSGDDTVSRDHFPYLPKFETIPSDELAHLKNMVVSMATVLWSRMLDQKDPTPLGHDGYVKAWQLSKPQINAGFLMVDEYQDTNPVLAAVINDQESTPTVGVGDPHQQIYEWRGAINAMTGNADFNCDLTKSFRFGQDIADFASDVLFTLGEKKRITGNERVTSTLTDEGQKVVLCRTNAQILDSLLAFAENKQLRKAAVVGGVSDLVNCLEGVERLQRGSTSAYPLFMGFKDWDEFLTYTQKSDDPDGVKIVKLTDKYGVQALKTVLQNTTENEKDADIVLSTAHKSKGREFEGVELANDFREQPEVNKETLEKKYNGPETRLFYVAATRAINRLKVPQWSRDLYKPEEQ